MKRKIIFKFNAVSFVCALFHRQLVIRLDCHSLRSPRSSALGKDAQGLDPGERQNSSLTDYMMEGKFISLIWDRVKNTKNSQYIFIRFV